jgi:hypothetical protein
VEKVAITSFVIGGLLRNIEVRENFAKNTQLTIYTTKPERVVSNSFITKGQY